MRSIVVAAACLFGLAWASPAHADVVSATTSGFVLSAQAEVAASPEHTWRALGRLPRWWNGSHTYSGDAGNLRLDLRAGGCWCERWGAGQIEHARVVLLMETEGTHTLRLIGGLGPLQDLGATGVLTFTVAPSATGSTLTMTYRVFGDAAHDFQRLAPLVDGVMMEQFGRLSRYSASGSPD